MEIIGSDFFCDLHEVHLNQIEPTDFINQSKAFKAGAITVASLLHHKFDEPRYQYSREIDPIVAVTFTGGFDFFVKALGVDWLRWWELGRPSLFWGYLPSSITPILDYFCIDAGQYLNQSGTLINIAQLFRRIEQEYLTYWKETVHTAVWKYCDRNNLRRPNRFTAIQPSGTKSLLTGATSGFMPPKAARYIRRITFRVNDPVALACIDYGYNIVPSQSDKDENGLLLNDPYDPRVTEWLVEIPTKTVWADIPGCDAIAVDQFSALAQYDWLDQVQQHYVTHNTSSTLELREHEIEPLGHRIYEAIQNDEGYISSALLARFDSKETFPRLPFEPIDKETYDRLHTEVSARRKTDDFQAALEYYDQQSAIDSGAVGPAGCDSDKCLIAGSEPV
jgi:ribonucleotide reductase class II